MEVIHGLTVIETGDGFGEFRGGKLIIRESYTKLFRDCTERDEYAIDLLKDLMEEALFDEDGDEFGDTFESLKEDYYRRGACAINFPDYHITFEKFEQEV